MTIITGRQFRANQGKYIGLAHAGERVCIKSRKGCVLLTPVVNDFEEGEESFQKYVSSKAFIAVAEQAEQEFKEGKTLHFESAADAQKWMDAL